MDAAKRIKALRRRLGLSQEQLAQKLGVSFVTINRWENGVKPSNLALDRIERLEREGQNG